MYFQSNGRKVSVVGVQWPKGESEKQKSEMTRANARSFLVMVKILTMTEIRSH